MENEIFEQEKQRLDYVNEYIDQTLFSETPNEANLRQSIIEERRRIWNDYSGDPTNVDLMQANQTLEMDTERYFRIRDKLYFLQKMRNSPYFARIDFTEDGYDDAESFYIGSLSLIDHRTYDILICDWRADIASLFYDATLGPAEYKCNEGVIRGDISLRRQIKIENGELQYVFDNGINITDPILMEELGKSSDAKLKTVINTIQKDQNAIIRDLNADLLLVQGTAGSGKTSVALHRIAYLLYKYRNSVAAQDIIIFSPSEVFSAYIAEVLPALGEENAVRSDFYHFLVPQDATERYADRSEQIEALLQSNDPFLREMISVKGSEEFVRRLSDYFDERYSSFRISENFTYYDEILASADELNQWFFSDYTEYTAEQRVGKITLRILDAAEDCKEEFCRAFLDEATAHGIVSLTDEEREEQCNAMWESCMAELKDRIRKAFLIPEKELYLDFLKQHYPEYHAYSADLFSREIIPYEDLFCLSWVRVRSGAIAPMRTVRQVVVDEAQEYPPIVYMLLSEIFPAARFTILGDISQQVDAKIPSVASLEKFFQTKKTVASFVLNKGYRSTYEINAFAEKFRTGDREIRMVERHGSLPAIVSMKNAEEQIVDIIKEYRSRGHKTNMILCRTQAECDDLYLRLMHKMPIIRMRSFDTITPETTIILPVYLSKGLEADGVIVAGVSSEWKTEEDRNLMYVAATRALHELTVLTEGDEIPLLS